MRSSRLPITQGCTFAAVTPMVLIGTTQGGLPPIYGAVIVSGLVVVAVAPSFAKIVRSFPAAGHRHHHHDHRDLAAARGRPLGPPGARAAPPTDRRSRSGCPPSTSPRSCSTTGPDWAQTILNSGIVTGSLLVIVLNLVFNHLRPARRES